MISPPAVPRDAAHSRYVQRIRRRYGPQLPCLAAGEPRGESLKQAYEALRTQGHAPGAALRILRQLVMERLVVLDCENDPPVPLTVVTDAMSELAEFALDVALRETAAELDARHGAPLLPEAPGEPARRARMWVVGMGKLGARELNVSSDIDLIYIYDHDGETAGLEAGRGRISNHEYFAKAVRQIYGLIGETTEHGFVFRVDLALRPNGNSGPPAVSQDALEEYLQVQGREWERFAWLKSRVVAPREAIANRSARALRGTILPFVFRR